jgi:serine/threonine protein kinase
LSAFAVSLIDTVRQMHSTALVLHCDILPANVIWNGDRVVLIDFGRAQPMLNKAYSEYGTKGFEAPELSEGKPHAPGTDTFPVGQIILYWLEKLGRNNWDDGDREGEAKAKAGSQPKQKLVRHTWLC